MPDPNPPTVVQLVDPKGVVRDVPANKVEDATKQGFRPVTDEDRAQQITKAANEDYYGGAGGTVVSSLAGLARGASLGISDAAIAALGGQRDLRGLKEAHPIASTASQIVGGVAPGLVGGLGATPAGYLASLASEGVDTAKAAGGIKALAGVAAVSGTEAAAQNAGMYLSDVALGNRDLTVEGMAGALGRSFLFGSVAGGATYGLEQGTIAARRMFAKTAEGGKDAAKLAADTFQRKTDELLQAHDDTVQAAQNQLDQIRQARAQAQAMKAGADTEIARAKVDLATQPQTEVPTTPVAPEAASPAPAPTPTPDVEASPPPVAPTPADTSAPAAPPTTPAPAPPPATDLEATLQQMKQRLDNGETLQSLQANPFTGMPEEALAAKETQLQGAINDAAERRVKVNDWIAKLKNPRVSYDVDAIAPEAVGEGQMPLIRGRRVEALPEDVTVEQSGGNIRTIGKGEYGLNDITPNSRILARGNGADFATGQKLDEAYQDAVERASAADTAPEREAALKEASDIEQQIHQYVRATKPQNAEVIDQIERVRAQQGRTGYHAAFARAERLAERESALPATLAKGEPASETAYLDALRAKDGEPINLSWYGVKPGSVEDINEAANVLGPYEKSVAKLADAVGPDAAPAAQQASAAVHAAEDNAERKVIDRTTRAIDDHVSTAGTPDEMPPKPIGERFGPDENFGPNMPEAAGPTRGTPRERIEAAKNVKLEQNAKLAKLREDEMGAKGELQKALEAQKNARKAAASAKASRVVVKPAEASPKTGILGTLEKAGELLEVAHMAGVHGLPSPEDIPVIGPVLGWYLKWRALGRVWGRIPATAEARAASLAAATRNKAAMAVDRMLGLAEKAAPVARDVAVRAGGRAAEALSQRIFDDGQPDAPKGASIQQQAAVRIRELASAASAPDQVVNKVRMQMRDVTDPDLIQAAEQLELRKVAYLSQFAPQAPLPSPLQTRQWVPSQADALQLGRRMEIADNPVAALEQIQAKTITPEAADTLRNVYPNLFAEVQQRLLQQSMKVDTAIPFDQRSRMGLLFQVPLDRLAEPETIAALHTSAPGSNSPAANPTQNQPPTPSVAGPVKLADLYETAADRRAARR